MKGVMSDANNLFATKVQQALMEGTIYGHVSGGDPAAIPDLTYEELKAFHAKHYHPSNACFFSYGDMSLTDHLQYLDEEILSKFEYRGDSAAVRVDNETPARYFQDTEGLEADCCGWTHEQHERRCGRCFGGGRCRHA
ncbi:hypothetical protein PINS_up017853 [Pythium insidiosum]|nr:hypothetical protein PINS_up017853 [Pythium insidiosum]